MSNMSKKIAINGFGRIGRLFSRIILDNFSEDMEIVAVNDLTSAENLAYLLQNDTTYRRFNQKVSVNSGNLIVEKEGKTKIIKVFSEKDPQNLPWNELNIDVVIESTGIFTTSELANKHLQAGSKRVIISAPAKSDDIPTIVLGVNPIPTDKIISNASCTTNCISPALKVFLDNFNVNNVNALTVHAFTATQVLQDGPSKKAFRDGRSAFYNIIPSTSGAAKAVELTLPQIKGKITVSAVRVPIITGSMTNLVINLDKHISKEEINQKLKEASDTYLKNILEYSTEDLVSTDIIGNSHSSIVDSNLTEVLDNTVKIVLWYDNEWGYATRLVELCNKI